MEREGIFLDFATTRLNSPNEITRDDFSPARITFRGSEMSAHSKALAKPKTTVVPLTSSFSHFKANAHKINNFEEIKRCEHEINRAL